MSLKVPIISVIIGEGGSGGAIALASANKVIMLENAIYSVISPEGCASILWRDPTKSLEAAKAMKLTANELLKINIIDEIIKEPIGGAHRNKEQIVDSTKKQLIKYLIEFENYEGNEIFEQRKKKFLNIGKERTLREFLTDEHALLAKSNIAILVKQFIFSKKFIIFFILIVATFFLINNL